MEACFWERQSAHVACGLGLRIKGGGGMKAFAFLTLAFLGEGDHMIWGNVLLGGIMGAGVDANTDANQELPDTITLNRQTCRGKPL